MTYPKEKIGGVLRHSSGIVRCAAETIAREKQLGAMGLVWRMGLWLAAYAVSRSLLDQPIDAQPLRVAIALLPAPFLGWFVWHWMRIVQKMDELERRVQLEALAFAFPLTVVWLTTIGLLSTGAPADGGMFSPQQSWLMLPLLYAIGLWRAHRRYR
jgi:hypothetical protein